MTAKKSSAKTSAEPKKEPKKKEYKLDLFGQTLPALYKGDLNFYANCTEDQRKEISPLILMRWVSLSESDPVNSPQLVNTFVNNGFWKMSKHPELQWKLLATVASTLSSRTPRHKWMMPKGKVSKTPLLDNYFLQMHPLVSNTEIDILKGKLANEDEVKELAKQFGASDPEIKAVVKEYRDNYGKKA